MKKGHGSANFEVLVQLSPDNASIEWLCEVMGADDEATRTKIQMAITALRILGWGIKTVHGLGQGSCGYKLDHDEYSIVRTYWAKSHRFSGRELRGVCGMYGLPNASLTPYTLAFLGEHASRAELNKQ